MSSKIIELFGIKGTSAAEWENVCAKQYCPYLGKKCIKIRKSRPDIAIGTCTVKYGKNEKNVIICPHRLIERGQIFTDCLHLLTLHEPGNELHIVSEIFIPGGSVDYFLISARNNKVRDFVGIELQTLDTTGTVWGERQRFLSERGVDVPMEDIESRKSFGMNWKMTAKTILVQLHHKIKTFESINKRLVLVIQNYLRDYMKEAFSFDHLQVARLGDSMQIHTYVLDVSDTDLRLGLAERYSTDAKGISMCLGLQADTNVALGEIVEVLESKISDETLLRIE